MKASNNQLQFTQHSHHTALAQKIAIRGYAIHTGLVELNACNLFSRWFSESPKLVAGVFEDVSDDCCSTQTAELC